MLNQSTVFHYLTTRHTSHGFTVSPSLGGTERQLVYLNVVAATYQKPSACIEKYPITQNTTRGRRIGRYIWLNPPR